MFKIDSRSGKPIEVRFCKLCSNKVASTAGSLSQGQQPTISDPAGRTQSGIHRRRQPKPKSRTNSVNATSFLTEESSEEEINLDFMISTDYSSASILEQEVTVDRESFQNGSADMVWMPDPSLNDSRSSVVVLLSDAERDQKVNHSYQRCDSTSSCGLSSRTCSRSSTYSDEEVEWSTLGLGQFDLGISESGTEDDYYLDRSRKHEPGRASHHRQYKRSRRPQDWENFVTDLYVLTPTSTGFFS